ncbi:MAG TPA: DUF6270 domain-containing protein [Tessaracoccus flavescens]|uniref:DUF6270 domain-containing protein n=1 Tax=Tessaracoccus flavescens TaxID=399497 RepID=A0A921EMM1_9ACTN|nr:DUF6270 domain-containing protein [Tessaracoccus flavescens]
MTTKTFIWGSCVSRDTFEFLPDSFELLGYVARQSWLSAGSRADVAIGELESKFQRKMTEGDLAGNALSRLSDNAGDIDLLLLDLCDERLGVVLLEGDAVVTRSVEKMTSGIQDQLDEAGHVLALGDPGHFERWRTAAARVRDELEAAGLLSKSLVLAVEWALMDSEAEPTPTSFGKSAFDMNQRFEAYYAELEALGFTLVNTGPTLADADHKWGRAAFHYHETTYEELVGQIVGKVRRPPAG